ERRKFTRHRRARHRAGAHGGKPRLLPAGGPRRARRCRRNADARGDLGGLLRGVILNTVTASWHWQGSELVLLPLPSRSRVYSTSASLNAELGQARVRAGRG